MENVIYIKSLENQELLINKDKNVITGAWMRDGIWQSDVDISALPFYQYPLLLERLNIQQKLVLGFSKDEQLFYAILLTLDNEFNSDLMVKGYCLSDVFELLNISLISIFDTTRKKTF